MRRNFKLTVYRTKSSLINLILILTIEPTLIYRFFLQTGLQKRADPFRRRRRRRRWRWRPPLDLPFSAPASSAPPLPRRRREASPLLPTTTTHVRNRSSFFFIRPFCGIASDSDPLSCRDGDGVLFDVFFLVVWWDACLKDWIFFVV